MTEYIPFYLPVIQLDTSRASLLNTAMGSLPVMNKAALDGIYEISKQASLGFPGD